MRVIRQSRDIFFPRVIALGTFDGVHLGHQRLLETGRELADRYGAKLRVCTFDRHPLSVLRPDRTPRELTSILMKAKIMARMGVDEMQLIPFNRQEANLSPEEFLTQLRKSVRVRAVVAGWNYTFGKGGLGTAETLRADGEQHGYEVVIVPPVTTADGRVISSSAIREALAAGDIAAAEEMLGRPLPRSGMDRMV